MHASDEMRPVWNYGKTLFEEDQQVEHAVGNM